MSYLTKHQFIGEAKSTSALIRRKIGLDLIVLCKSNVLTNVNVILQSLPDTLFTKEYAHLAICPVEVQLIKSTYSRKKGMMPRAVVFLQLVVANHRDLGI